MKKSKDEQIDGIMLIDKPSGMTSHDVVDLARKSFHIRRIGHTGTLDPFATGLLILCIGKATRLARFIAEEDKIYRGRITLGIETDTYDSDGKIISSLKGHNVSLDTIAHAATTLTGQFQQLPPPFSAKKISGIRSYELARNGKIPELKLTDVTVHYFKIRSLAKEHIDFETKVSAGTYIRSLAHDLGKILGCGAHLSKLERRASGTFKLRSAVKLSLVQRSTVNELKEKVIPLSRIPLPMPSAIISKKGCAFFSNGRPVPRQYFAETLDIPQKSRVCVYSSTTELLGIGIFTGKSTQNDTDTFILPTVVLS